MLTKNVGGAGNDLADFWFFVIFKTMDDAEAVAERAGESAGSSRRADDGKMREVEADAAGGRAFADDDVEFVIFHRGVEDFFDDAAEAVDFVNEQDVAVLEIGEDAGEVAGAFDGGAGGDAKISAEFVGDNVSHSGFAEAGRAVEEDVVERGAVASFFDGVDGELKVGLEAFLADVFRKASWT